MILYRISYVNINFQFFRKFSHFVFLKRSFFSHTIFTIVIYYNETIKERTVLWIMSKLLIVDDEANIREVVREYAEFSGYDVEEAEDLSLIHI